MSPQYFIDCVVDVGGDFNDDNDVGGDINDDNDDGQ